MIKLDRKTQQDFLNREWCKKLVDAGIDMSDAKYYIYTNPDNHCDYIGYKAQMNVEYALNCIPTYTTAELLYKLNEYPSIELQDGIKEDHYYISAPLKIFKDAPFYIASYYFSHPTGVDKVIKEYREYDIECESEYPIEALAQLLVKSATSNFHNFKYDNDISDK